MNRYDPYTDSFISDEYYECSVCKDAFVLMEGTPKENNYNYCPNCGADMRGEQK
jgi:predicted nucleic acid-binding Zn ribbon protein